MDSSETRMRYVVPLGVKKKTSRRVQVSPIRVRAVLRSGEILSRGEGQPEIIILREYRARILTRHRDARIDTRLDVPRIDYDSSVVDRNVRIYFYPLLVLESSVAFLARSCSRKIEPTLDRTLAVGCEIASTRW